MKLNRCHQILTVMVLLVLHFCEASQDEVSGALELRVVTIATEETDGFVRFMRSVRHFGLNAEVVGMGEKWMGGDIMREPGGGHKINLLRPTLEQWKDQQNLIVMFVDSYDVIFAEGADKILQKFLEFDARLVFSAEGFCWPDLSLASSYPRVGLGKRFLCSGGFLGYAHEVWEAVSAHVVQDKDDDQLYYTRLFLDETQRQRLGMRLDHRSHIFQNLNGAEEEVELVAMGNSSYAQNTLYGTKASVYHGNGPSKIFLNFLGNYIPNMWSEEGGCVECREGTITLPPSHGEWPSVTLSLHVAQPTPFLAEVLERVTSLDYPKASISLWVHNTVAYHETLVAGWVELIGSKYIGMHYTSSSDGMEEAEGREQAMLWCLENKCDFFFAVDSTVMFDHSDALQRLVELNRSVVAPLLSRPQRMFSNFWGSIASNGFYARSTDYFDLVSRKRLGVWNVPFVSSAILFKGAWLRVHSDDLPSYHSETWETDMAFCSSMRDKGLFMYVSNLQEYGHLINPDSFQTTHLNNDLYQIFDNRMDWEHKYLHENYSQVLLPSYTIEQPCPDVYWFPILSEVFCKELVEEMEHFGQWSSGTHDDERLEGGYENVPTRDIHMNQVGLEEQWLEVIKSYIVPVQLKAFPGYYSRGNSFMNFVVKYHPQGQAFLRPHHDSSTFTVNVALSRPHIDYEGGGCRFVRYNCSVVDTRLGWTFMHPGRLTHYHEGLPVIQGTRYIMVSFVDP